MRMRPVQQQKGPACAGASGIEVDADAETAQYDHLYPAFHRGIGSPVEAIFVYGIKLHRGDTEEAKRRKRESEKVDSVR